MKTMQQFGRNCLVISVLYAVVACSQYAIAQTAGITAPEVQATITIKDIATGKEKKFNEVLPSKVVAPSSGVETKDREQVCTEFCKKSCYGTNPSSGDWACYWTCRWYCKPPMGGDPRKKQIKSMSVMIETDTSRPSDYKTKPEIKGKVVVKDSTTGREASFDNVMELPLPASIQAHIPSDSRLKTVNVSIELAAAE